MPEFLQRLRSIAPTNSRPLHPTWVVIAISVWLATACNVPLWMEVNALPGQNTLRGWAFIVAFGIIVAAGNAALLALLAWRWTLKPAATVLVLMAAFGAYFMLAYGITIDASMLVNVLQTDTKEAGDLLNLRLFATVAALAAPPLLWLYTRSVGYPSPVKILLHNSALLLASIGMLVLCLLLVFQDFASTMRNHTKLRYLINPLNSVYALGNIATRPLRMDTRTILPVGRDARLGASYAAQNKPALLVLVVGETARSSNFGINGYERATTPRLSARSDIVSARNAWSCGTSTAASLPCMFSHLGRSGYEGRKANHESLMDVLHHAGLGVLWVDNQAGCKGVCDRVSSIDTSQTKDPQWCASGDCLDEVMLQNLDQQLADLPAERRNQGTVIVLHQMGSHGPAYFKRSLPAHKVFGAECQSTSLQACSREQLINAYDHSIVATDDFLHSVLQWLSAREQQYQTAMMYVSDHGESLGENNIYLHGLPYAIAPNVQKQVPWITWLSPAMQARLQLNTACLQRDQTDRQITHDHYFHTVLGLMDVQTEAYQPQLDLLTACSGSPQKTQSPNPS